MQLKQGRTKSLQWRLWQPLYRPCVTLGHSLQPAGISCMLVFGEGGKPENPEKNPRSREENQHKLNPLMALGPGIEPGPHCGRRALSPLHHPCFPYDIFHKMKTRLTTFFSVSLHQRPLFFTLITPKYLPLFRVLICFLFRMVQDSKQLFAHYNQKEVTYFCLSSFSASMSSSVGSSYKKERQIVLKSL